jgi:hypothetical protein
VFFWRVEGNDVGYYSADVGWALEDILWGRRPLLKCWLECLCDQKMMHLVDAVVIVAVFNVCRSRHVAANFNAPPMGNYENPWK